MAHRLGVVTTHPIQYQAPLFRAVAKESEIALTVLFGSRHGLSPTIDPGFGKAMSWDVPLLEGYEHVFLENSRQGISVNDRRLDAPELRKRLRKRPFDTLLVSGWSNRLYWQAIGWARRYRIPLVLRAESSLRHEQPWSVRLAKRVLFPLFFAQFQAFLAVGTHNAGLYRHFGVPERKIFWAPYCVDNDFFARRAEAATEAGAAVRHSLGIGEHETVFLFVAKFIERKRPADLIRACALLGENAGVHAILVGDGPLHGDCAALKERVGLRNVHLVGFKNQTELGTFHRAANALVLPSQYETWGLVVNEAMASGLPCIVSDRCGCAADAIAEGETGFTYSVGNVQSLATAMRRIADDPEALPRMSKAARAMADRFSVGATVSALHSALKSTSPS